MNCFKWVINQTSYSWNNVPELVKFCLWTIIGPLEIKWFYSNPRSYFTLLLRRQIFQHYILTCFEKSLKFLCRSTYPIIMGYVKWSMVLSSPEPKAQMSFSDQNLSVVRRCRRKLFTFSSSTPDSLGKFQPNLAQSILGCRGFNFIQIKVHALSQGEIITKLPKYIDKFKKSSSPEPLGQFQLNLA